MTKRCGRCDLEKEAFQFSKSKKGGLQSWCKTCQSLYFLENKDRARDLRRVRHKENPQFYAAQMKKYVESHKEDVAAYKKEWYLSNKDRLKKKNANNYIKNKPEYIARVLAYKKNRKKTDVSFRISECLRSRLHSAIKNGQKTGSAIRDLGCSIDELKKYLESNFKPGMSWDNYGYYGWHIDHIKPLSKFDLTCREQLLEACHFTNLQPMWWKENISKGNRTCV